MNEQSKPVKITGTWAFPRLVDTMAPDRGGNALALPIILSFMVIAFSTGVAVGWWAWS